MEEYLEYFGKISWKDIRDEFSQDFNNIDDPVAFIHAIRSPNGIDEESE